MITAVAGLIAAISGLIVALNRPQTPSQEVVEQIRTINSSNELQQVPLSEFSKLRVITTVFPPGGVEVDVENGSVWTVKAIAVRVQLIDPAFDALVYDKVVTLPLKEGSDGSPFKMSSFRGDSALSDRPRERDVYRVRSLGMTKAFGMKSP
jgi:hypothetical protein